MFEEPSIELLGGGGSTSKCAQAPITEGDLITRDYVTMTVLAAWREELEETFQKGLKSQEDQLEKMDKRAKEDAASLRKELEEERGNRRATLVTLMETIGKLKEDMEVVNAKVNTLVEQMEAGGREDADSVDSRRRRKRLESEPAHCSSSRAQHQNPDSDFVQTNDLDISSPVIKIESIEDNMAVEDEDYINTPIQAEAVLHAVLPTPPPGYSRANAYYHHLYLVDRVSQNESEHDARTWQLTPIAETNSRKPAKPRAVPLSRCRTRRKSHITEEKAQKRKISRSLKGGSNKGNEARPSKSCRKLEFPMVKNRLRTETLGSRSGRNSCIPPKNNKNNPLKHGGIETQKRSSSLSFTQNEKQLRGTRLNGEKTEDRVTSEIRKTDEQRKPNQPEELFARKASTRAGRRFFNTELLTGLIEDPINAARARTQSLKYSRLKAVAVPSNKEVNSLVKDVVGNKEVSQQTRLDRRSLPTVDTEEKLASEIQNAERKANQQEKLFPSIEETMEPSGRLKCTRAGRRCYNTELLTGLIEDPIYASRKRNKSLSKTVSTNNEKDTILAIDVGVHNEVSLEKNISTDAMATEENVMESVNGLAVTRSKPNDNATLNKPTKNNIFTSSSTLPQPDFKEDGVTKSAVTSTSTSKSAISSKSKRQAQSAIENPQKRRSTGSLFPRSEITDELFGPRELRRSKLTTRTGKRYDVEFPMGLPPELLTRKRKSSVLTTVQKSKGKDEANVATSSVSVTNEIDIDASADQSLVTISTDHNPKVNETSDCEIFEISDDDDELKEYSARSGCLDPLSSFADPVTDIALDYENVAIPPASLAMTKGIDTDVFAGQNLFTAPPEENRSESIFYVGEGNNRAAISIEEETATTVPSLPMPTPLSSVDFDEFVTFVTDESNLPPAYTLQSPMTLGINLGINAGVEVETEPLSQHEASDCSSFLDVSSNEPTVASDTSSPNLFPIKISVVTPSTSNSDANTRRGKGGEE